MLKFDLVHFQKTNLFVRSEAYNLERISDSKSWASVQTISSFGVFLEKLCVEEGTPEILSAGTGGRGSLTHTGLFAQLRLQHQMIARSCLAPVICSQVTSISLTAVLKIKQDSKKQLKAFSSGWRKEGEDTFPT